jgi:hypothetical protein
MDTGRSISRFNPVRNAQTTEYTRLQPTKLASTTNFLFLAMQSQGANDAGWRGTHVFQWSPEGWHTITYIGDRISVQTRNAKMFYSSDHSALLLSTHAGNFAIYLPDLPVNPYYHNVSYYHGYGWLETGRFYADRYLIDKHFDSVYIRAENLSGSNQDIQLFYQSEDDSAWTLLGSITATTDTVRWTGGDLTGRWMRLGVRLHSNDINETPRLLASVIKYQSMLTDRARWTLPIEIDGSQYVDGWDYSEDGVVADTVDRLMQLRNAVEPLIYEDIDGAQYEVKMISYSRSLTKYDYHEDADQVEYNAIYTLVLEQFQPGEYAG